MRRLSPVRRRRHRVALSTHIRILQQQVRLLEQQLVALYHHAALASPPVPWWACSPLSTPEAQT